MDGFSKGYQVLEEEKETALDSSSKDPEQQTSAASKNGSNLLSSHNGDPPKISGKAWGRVYKFFSGIGHYPKAIPFIVGNEFCERFTYYGLRTVLILYLTEHMLYSDDTATALYHTFVMLCYLTPVIGAMIADGFLGKYKTILYLSVVYACGNIFLAGTSAPLHDQDATKIVPLIGLLLIAFGTGGIKPCVSAFGGDQFQEGQTHLLQRYFSIFYFSINAGSVLSTLISPLLRSNTKCFGEDCYLYAFGLPAILMIVAIMIFVAGSRYYIKREPSGNVIAQVCYAVALAVKRRITERKSGETHRKFMYWAGDKYDRKFLDDVSSVGSVVVLLLPVPIFWTLFDQTGSRWTLQAKRMNGKIGDATIEPDQMQVANALLILFFIPIFESIIYPGLRKCKIPMRPLQRMSLGMIFAGLSFVVAAFIQLKIEAATDAWPSKSVARVRFLNALPTEVNATLTDLDRNSTVWSASLPYAKHYPFDDLAPGTYQLETVTMLEGTQLSSRRNFTFSGRSVQSLIAGVDESNQIELFEVNHDVSKLGGEEVAVQVVNSNSNFGTVWCYLSKYDKDKKKLYYTDFQFSSTRSGIGVFNSSAREVIDPPGTWELEVFEYGTNRSLENNTIVLENGGMYTLLLLPSKDESTKQAVEALTDVHPADVHILLQVPQYAVLTAGEVMFSITGLEFAYSQAPLSMKSVMQAVWLLTVAIGNLVVVIVAEARIFSDQVLEFIFFASLIGVVTLIFIAVSLRYKYVDRANAAVDTNGTILTHSDKQQERYTLLDKETDRSKQP